MKTDTAIKSAMGVNVLINESDIEKVAIDLGLDVSENYVKEDKAKVNAAAGFLLFGLYQIASVSEGGFSLSFNKDVIEARLKFLSSNSDGLFPLPEAFGPKDKVKALNIH